MTALEAYRAYSGKTTRSIAMRICVNGNRVDSVWRSLGKYACNGPVANTVTFRLAEASGSMDFAEDDEVTLGEW